MDLMTQKNSLVGTGTAPTEKISKLIVISYYGMENRKVDIYVLNLNSVLIFSY